MKKLIVLNILSLLAFSFVANAQLKISKNIIKSEHKINLLSINVNDTLFPDPFKQTPCGDTLAIYGIEGGGYITGSNVFYNEVYQSFSGINKSMKTSIVAVCAYLWTNTDTSNNKICVKVYNLDTLKKLPIGNAVGTSDSITIKNINDSIKYTIFNFTNPAIVDTTGGFAISFATPISDTAVIRSTIKQSDLAQTCNQYFTDSAGFLMSGIWQTFAYNFLGKPNFELALFPVIAQSNNINENTFYNGLKLNNAPNPASTSTRIYYELSKHTNKIKFEVIDSKGKIVYSNNDQNRNIGRYSFELETSKLSKGIYFYTLSTDYGKIAKKLIVE